MRTRLATRTSLACRVCSSKMRQKDRFCWYCGTSVAAGGAPTTRPIGAAVAAPASASLQVGEQKAFALEEQRKSITILFIDLQGSTPLAERLDPEELRTVLGRYFSTVSRHIQHFGGTIDKYIGDAVMAVFGAPVSHEDDAARAIGAALGIKADMARENKLLQQRHGVQLVLRTGINTGEVVAGMLSGEVQAAYTVTGDAVNTAQRLEGAAPPNEVLISEGTYALARNAFVFEAVAPLTLKGKAEPVPAYRVVGRERRASARSQTSLIGRVAELDALFGGFRAAAAGTGQVLHLHGEAGVGKTRLVSEFLTKLGEGVQRLRARASSYEVATPYAVVADLIRRSFQIELGESEADVRAAIEGALVPLELAQTEGAIVLLLEVLGYGERSPLPPETKRQFLVSLLTAYLRHRSRVASVVAIEDVHWIDGASADVFAEVANAIRTLPCLLLTTARETLGGRWDATEIALQPLGEQEAGALVDAIAEGKLDADTRALVLERTAGNPFFVEEVVRALGSGRASTVPLTVHELLEAKVDALDESPRHVAQRSAVIGRTFWTRVLELVCAGREIEPDLAILDNERFIAPFEEVPQRKYAFRHALLQEVVYATQLVSQRRSAHALVGGAIEAVFAARVDEFTDILAFHYDHGDDDTKALEWLSRAGDRAKALYANAEAVGLYGAALRRASDGDGPLGAGSLLERISDVQWIMGRYDDAIDSLHQARARIPERRRVALARLHRKTGLALRMKDAYPEAIAAYTAALDALGDEEDIERAFIRLGVGDLELRRGDPATARQAAEVAVGIAERLSEDVPLMEGLNQLGTIARRAGSVREAADYYRRALVIAERGDDPWKLSGLRNNLGMVVAQLGQYEESLALHRSSLALRERMGAPFFIGQSYHNMGDVHRYRDELEEAESAYRRCLELWVPLAYTSGIAATHMFIGDVRLRAGDAARALVELREAEAGLDGVGNKRHLPELYRLLAEANLHEGNVDPAHEYARRSLELAVSLGSRPQAAATQRVLGELALAAGDHARALGLFEESRAALTEMREMNELRRTEAAIRRIAG